MTRRLALMGTFILLASLVPGVAAAQSPDNDDVGAATRVTAIPFDDVVEIGEATVEEGEPTETCAPFANTVWYALTLDAAEDVFIDTAGSGFDTAIAVWVGSSFDDVELVACNDDTFASLEAATTITAESGVTYLVQVGAFGEAPPEAVLTISFGEAPKGGKPFIAKDSFRGKLAEAFVEEFDEETGTFAYRAVNVVDGRVQSKGSAPARVRELFVEAFQESLDEEAGTFTFTSWLGFAELDPDDYSIDKRLRSAWVEKEMSLHGETCTEFFGDGEDEPVFECTLFEATVVVDVEWDGDGPVMRIRDRFSNESEGFRIRFWGTSRAREASVSGGVSGGVAIDFTDAYGRIAKDANGSWFWNRGLGGGFFGFGGPEMAMEGSALASAMTEVMFDRFRGRMAGAFDEQFDEETGTFSFQDVNLMLGRMKAKGDKWMSMDEVSVSWFSEQFDEEAETFTFTEWFGSAPAPDGVVDRKLRHASVEAEVVLFGLTCTESFGEPNGEEPEFDCTELGETTVMVDVSWEGSGPTFTSRSSSDFVSGGEHMRFSGRSTSREAVANGVVQGEVVGWTYEDAPGFLGRNVDGYWFKG